MALQRPQPPNQCLARWKINIGRSQFPVSQLPDRPSHPPVYRTKQNSRQKCRYESLSSFTAIANLAAPQTLIHSKRDRPLQPPNIYVNFL